jgi:hypothetical protein
MWAALPPPARIFFEGSPSKLFSATQPGAKKRRMGNFATAIEQKEDSMVYGGMPDTLFASCFLTENSTEEIMLHDLR